MSQSNLNYDDYKKINELIEGYNNIDGDILALANRPLPSVKQCPCLKEGRNDLSKVKPYYSDGEFQKSTGNTDKEIPIIIKKKSDQYLVLESKTDDNVYVDSWADLPKNNEESEKAKKPKMDWITQFYVGSLSVVALFVVFRMIQKTK